MATIPDRELEEMASASSFQPSLSSHIHEANGQSIARLRLLWDHRRFLVRIAAWGLLFATIIAFLIPKRYESSTLLMPPDDQSGAGMMMLATLSGKLSGGLGSMAGDLLSMKSSGDLFIGVLRSRTVEDDVIAKFDLRRVYGTSDWHTARLALSEKTAISEDRKSGIITITVTDHDPQRAAGMAHEYVTELNTVVSQLSTSAAHRERVFLEERLAQVKQDLENAEKEFSEFSSKNATLDIKEQGKAMVEGAAALEGQLIAAQSELQGLKQIYSDNNVRVRSLHARVAELQKQLGQLNGKPAVTADSVAADSSSLYPSIRALPLLGVPYADLYRRARVQEAVFETLTQQYEMAKVQEAKEIPTVKVLDPPNVPEHKSFPPRLVVMILGLLFGFASAVVWTLAKSRWQDVDPDAPHKVLAQEIFATFNASMPWAPPNGSRLQAASHKVWSRIAQSRRRTQKTIPDQDSATEN